MVKIGLEIHQQLNTKKLFCDCESYLSETVLGSIKRELRAALGESGNIDIAALEEAKRKRVFTYELTENSCLVEADEEPPHKVNSDALDTALIVSILLNCVIIDEIQFMRKIVIDGSNTTGFQRTALVGKDGYLMANGSKISISSVCLEEESARKISEKEENVVYRLDRLGIPLIEISTGPDMTNGLQVKEVAQQIGNILRSISTVKRGLGTIRQDINISTDGSRVEVKGVSQLRLIQKIVENEIRRQQNLSLLKTELEARKFSKFELNILNVSDIFKNTESKIIRDSLKSGAKVMGFRVPCFAGLLKSEKFRFGKELAEHVKVFGIKGIFHSDELPAYGITDIELKSLNRIFELGALDAFILICEKEDRAKMALTEIYDRINRAIEGVIGETRGPKDDGTTEYLRPLPGKERMYPETDVPPIPVYPEKIELIKNNLPEQYDAKVSRFLNVYKISKQEAEQIINNGQDELFCSLASVYDQYSIISRTLLSTLSELENEGLSVESISDDDLITMFKGLAAKKFAKEAIPDILKLKVAEHKNISDIIEQLENNMYSEDKVREIINSILQKNRAVIADKGENAFSTLMGAVMSEIKGKYDGKKVSMILKEELSRFSK
jgi:glutamyl-tRNA(Gln) amidotransferase subunit E